LLSIRFRPGLACLLPGRFKFFWYAVSGCEVHSPLTAALEGMTRNDSHPPKSKRRWYQFSLRTLLVFMLVCGAGLGWLAMKMQRARKQREAVEVVLKAGGTVFYDYQLDETGAWIRGAQPTAPVWLRKSLGDDFFYEVIEVYLIDTQVTDAGLEHLKDLPNLQTLLLNDTQVTDAGLEHLKKLPNVECLGLGGTQVSDAGLGHLNGLTKLK